MTDQAALFDAKPTVKLTDRQRQLLEHVARCEGGASDDELGSYVHELRRDGGGRGHDRDTRCDYCAGEGQQAGAALRAKGLLVKRRRARAWQLTREAHALLDRQDTVIDWKGF